MALKFWSLKTNSLKIWISNPKKLSNFGFWISKPNILNSPSKNLSNSPSPIRILNTMKPKKKWAYSPVHVKCQCRLHIAQTQPCRSTFNNMKSHTVWHITAASKYIWLTLYHNHGLLLLLLSLQLSARAFFPAVVNEKGTKMFSHANTFITAAAAADDGGLCSTGSAGV